MKKNLLLICILFSYLAVNKAAAQINYQWVKSIGSSSPGDDAGKSLVVDNAGYIYVTGKISYGSAPTNFNPYGTIPVYLTSTGPDCFFAKYNPNGNCEWVKNIGLTNSSGAIGTSIAVDGASNVYVLGEFAGKAGFNPLGGDSLTSAGGSVDCFFAKYLSDGTFQWVRQFGGSGEDEGAGIVVDPSGYDIFLTGYFKSSIANFSNNSAIDTTLTNASDKDIFLAKYGSDGVFKWAKSIGGSGEDIGTAIDANDSSITITGSFQGSVDFNPGVYPQNLVASGLKDAFVAKYQLDGSFGWAVDLGHAGGNTALGTGVAIDANNIYVTGIFKGNIDFDPNNSKQANGRQDIFFALYHINDQSLGFGYNIGSSANSQTDSASSSDIIVDPSGNIYLTGTFEGKADFNPSQGGDTLESSGQGDIFFGKYANNGDLAWAKRMGCDSIEVGYGIAVDNSENIYLTGAYQGTVNFDPGAGIATRTCSDNFGTDLFISKYRPGGTSTITGNVSYNNIALNNGNNIARLYTQITNDGNAAMHLEDEVSIDPQGNYSFSDVNTDNYLVLAIADTATYPTLAATYYGDSTHWEQAIHIITSPNIIDTANIMMRGYPTLTGDASLSGLILEGDGYDRTAGTPIQGTEVGLDHDPGGSIMAHTTTGSDGKYTFNNIPAGCYKIYINIPGLPMDSTYHKCLDSLDNITHLDFIADSSSIYIDPTPTAINQIALAKIKMQVFPNPYKSVISIEFTMVTSNRVQLEVYNLLGEKMAEFLNEQKQAGLIKCRFNPADKGLKAGIYLLKLKVGGEISTKKIIQIE